MSNITITRKKIIRFTHKMWHSVVHMNNQGKNGHKLLIVTFEMAVRSLRVRGVLSFGKLGSIQERG